MDGTHPAALRGGVATKGTLCLLRNGPRITFAMKICVVSLCLALCAITGCDTPTERQAARQADRPRETVNVKYRGEVDLAPFDCEWVTGSSVVNRLCYDSKEQYVIVSLGGIYYHYCEVPAEIVRRWREADSMGRFYNAQVKGRFDCRVNRMPIYAK
jgi:hypothetical protein